MSHSHRSPFTSPHATWDRPVKRVTINDADRAAWVENCESLYLAQQSSRQTLPAYVRSNRGALDSFMRSVVGGAK